MPSWTLQQLKNGGEKDKKEKKIRGETEEKTSESS